MYKISGKAQSVDFKSWSQGFKTLIRRIHVVKSKHTICNRLSMIFFFFFSVERTRLLEEHWQHPKDNTQRWLSSSRERSKSNWLLYMIVPLIFSSSTECSERIYNVNKELESRHIDYPQFFSLYDRINKWKFRDPRVNVLIQSWII